MSKVSSLARPLDLSARAKNPNEYPLNMSSIPVNEHPPRMSGLLE